MEVDSNKTSGLQKSTLLKLPPEIRFQIYGDLFKGQTLKANAFRYPRSEGELQSQFLLQSSTSLLNVLLACRAIHDEAITVLYHLVGFRFERHSMDDINWSLTEVKATFPAYRPIGNASTSLESTRNLVRYVYYAGNDHNLIRSIGHVFPNLKSFEVDLSWDHLGVDQTNFDRAMKYAIRNREWRHAIKDALEQRFPEGMVHAIWELQKSSQAQRGFSVVLHWRLAYRFIEFLGECELDEWVLHVRDPEGKSRNVYDIRQDPLFFEMG